MNLSVVWKAGRNESEISVMIDTRAFSEGVFFEESVAMDGWRAIDGGTLTGGARICGDSFCNVGHVGEEMMS